MSRLPALAGSAAVAVLVAAAALGVVHHRLMVVQAVVAGGVALMVAVAVRRSWDHLPGYVAVGLDLGVVAVAALVAALGHALSLGIPYAVLRGPEVMALTGATVLLGSAVAALAYTHLRLAAEVEAQERRMAQLERKALESRLSALSAQINPHFLFNTLNTLAEVVHEDEDAAEDLVTDLSAMMRYALRASSQRVPLSQELDVIRRLLRMEEARLGERLTWSIEGESVLEHGEPQVPGLLIQPLVENAVKYAAAARTEGGEVRVVLTREGGRVTVAIADDGPGLPDAVLATVWGGEQVTPSLGTEHSGGGLLNCAERLRLTWPDGRATLNHDPSQRGTHLSLTLPVEAPCP